MVAAVGDLEGISEPSAANAISLLRTELQIRTPFGRCGIRWRSLRRLLVGAKRGPQIRPWCLIGPQMLLEDDRPPAA